MPEGPSIIILKEKVQQFSGQKIKSATGTTAIDLDRIQDKSVIAFKTWGKHFLICFTDFTIKIHLLMFGTYLINSRKATSPLLNLTFSNGEINFYTCSIKILEGDINTHYDWSEDVMNEKWNAKKAKEKLDQIPNKMICDSLLEQTIFSGVGNIIKNEILYRTLIHPESLIGKISNQKIDSLIAECTTYSFEFLHWKKKEELSKHWLAYSKNNCPKCNRLFIKKNTGLKKRKSFFCENCQKLYS